MNVPVTEDGVFDGALLFDGREYRSPDGIVAFAHKADRLGFVKELGTYFRAEFLCKKDSSVGGTPIWDDSRSPTICGSLDEARDLVNDYVFENQQASA